MAVSRWHGRPAGARARDLAIAEAAALRARDRIARLREEGDDVHDEADFIAREIEQVFLDIEARRAGTAE